MNRPPAPANQPNQPAPPRARQHPAPEEEEAGYGYGYAYGEDESAARGPKSDKIKRLLLDLLGRWHWIALGLVLGLLVAFYQLSKAPKIYTATSTLLVKQRTTSVIGPSDQMTEIDMRTVEAMNTIAERLKRFELLERVASREDVRQLPGLIPPKVEWMPEWAAKWFPKKTAKDEKADATPDVKALAGKIAGWIEISIRRSTRLLDISISHQVPEVAKKLADAIAREYITEIAGNRFAGRSTAIDLLKREADDARKLLREANTAHASYTRAIETHAQLEAKESEVEELARRYLPKHPKMIAAQAQLDVLKKRFLTEFEAARLSKADEGYWNTASAELEAADGDPEKRLTIARRLLLSRISVLESEMSSQKQVFNALLIRMQENSIEQETPDAEIEISNLATTPDPSRPTSPKPVMIFVTGGFGGLGVGVAIAFLFIKLDNKFHTVSQLEGDTGLPVLAAITDLKPKFLAAAERQSKRRSKKSKKSQNNTDPLDPPQGQKQWDKHIVFRHELSSSSFAEMFRVLRASISLLGDEKQRQVTLFTSAIPGEGKTLVSANFALAAAGQGRKTLLIDLDLRKPAMQKAFGLQRDHAEFGITEVLAGHAELSHAITPLPGFPDLHLILAGSRAPNPGELLNTTRLEEILAYACEHYEAVILDTAPLLAVPDTRVIAPFADNLCLVVRAEYTPTGAVHRALELLEEARTPPSGCILNGFTEKKLLMSYNYSYGNYKYGRHGQAYKYGYGNYGVYGED